MKDKEEEYNYHKGAKLVYSILIQLVGIPISNWMLFNIIALIHPPKSDFIGGMDFYELTIAYLIFFILVTIPIINILSIYLPLWLISSIHITWFAFIIYLTFCDLKYRPYDHGLTLFCIGLTIPIRLILKKRLKL